MFIRLIKYIKGTVEFKVTVADGDGFIKELSKYGKIYEIRRKGIDLYGSCTVATYRSFAPLVKKYHGRRRVLKRRGIRFQIYKRRARLGLPIGILAAFILFIVLSQFIWSIEINGENEELKAALREALPSYGIKNGAYKRSLDTKSLENQILADFPDIAFLAINISGSNISVEIDEVDKSPVKDKGGKFGNIIAKSEGKIISPNVYNGVSLIKEGDYVFKGELLVSGTREDYFGRTIFLNSDADIYAETENALTIKLPKVQLKEIPTGKKIIKRYISIFNFNIPLHLHFFDKGFYNDTVTGKRFELFGKELPVFYTKVELEEVYYEEIIKTSQELEREARELLEAELENLDDRTEVSLKDISLEENENEIILTAIYTAVENIAEYVPFEVN
ncbi:MAG: sporulation protein YqfD [Oscillospiraceae bacterium]|nr:sporulation protein YqfD [Oscillospiraceae bacterium]